MQLQRARDPGEFVDVVVVVVDLRAVTRPGDRRHQRVAHLRRALAHPAHRYHIRPVDLVRYVRRHRCVAEQGRNAVSIDDGPALGQDAIRRHRDAVHRVPVLFPDRVV